MHGRNHTDENAYIDKEISVIKGSAIIEAAYRNNLSCLEMLLNANGSVDAKDIPTQKTALRYAISNENFEAIKLLLDHGSNIEDRDINGYTALMAAFVNGQLSVSEFLVKNKADPYVFIHKIGDSILHLIIEKNANEGHIQENMTKTFDYILKENNTLLEHANFEGLTPYLYACYKGLQTVMDYLKEKGADTHAKGKDGKTCAKLCHGYEAKRVTEGIGCLPIAGKIIIIGTGTGEKLVKISYSPLIMIYRRVIFKMKKKLKIFIKSLVFME